MNEMKGLVDFHTYALLHKQGGTAVLEWDADLEFPCTKRKYQTNI